MWEYERKIAFWFIVLPGAVLLLYTIFGNTEIEKPKNENRFAIVDSYKKCDVVRYEDKSQHWNYFLHCP